MLLNSRSILLFLILCSYQITLAQDNPKAKDTAKMYRDIEKYSKKGKFTKFLHKLVFEPGVNQKLKLNSFYKIKKQNDAQCEGKIIRNINITTLDP